jgi:hypothetical protein
MHQTTTTETSSNAGRQGAANAAAAVWTEGRRGEPGDTGRSSLRRGRPARGDIDQAALLLAASRGTEILATARSYAATLQDAEDAYRRGLEILLRRRRPPARGSSSPG